MAVMCASDTHTLKEWNFLKYVSSFVCFTPLTRYRDETNYSGGIYLSSLTPHVTPAALLSFVKLTQAYAPHLSPS